MFISPKLNILSRCGAVGSALVLGEVASTHGVRYSEQNEAPRSTSEMRKHRVVGHRKRVAKTFSTI